ncbi:POTRA domain-containing protein [Pantoea tagorei]
MRLSPPASSFGRINFPAEKPCFPIARVELQGQQALPHWLPLQRIASQAQGKCLGAQGINLLMSALQNRLVDHGYVTTRVLAPSQDLNSGALRLVILPGYVREAKLTPDSDRHLWLYSAFPAHAGNLLDLRDIEQGLENLQRLPTVQADMSVVPGEQPGESDIQVRWKQQKNVARRPLAGRFRHPQYRPLFRRGHAVARQPFCAERSLLSVRHARSARRGRQGQQKTSPATTRCRSATGCSP